jgi:signal transduction histidine kinase
VEVHQETEPRVFGNRNELEQVFFNLMANALDAMPTGGRVDIHIGAGDPGELAVTFSDTGEGIPAENHDEVFLPFFTTKDYGKGTGLGLSIVARIVHEHGGRIELKSSAGKGTTFHLSLPRARQTSGTTALIEDS